MLNHWLSLIGNGDVVALWLETEHVNDATEMIQFQMLHEEWRELRLLFVSNM
jgi:nitrous oxide reductase accessory protein NosL